MGLQMVGHVYHTTSVLLWSTCILRFIHGKNKDKTPLRMRVDGFADGGTRISHHNRAKTVHMYILGTFSRDDDDVDENEA